MAFDPDLPDELQEYGPSTSENKGMSEADRQEMLQALGVAIAAKRDEAIKARKNSGIEEIWVKCEEAYLCIDDSNRGEYSGAKWAKPIAMNGPVTTNAVQKNPNKSSAFVRLTSRYVDAGAARVSETVLPIDGKAFSFGPTPMPDLVTLKEDMTQLVSGGEPLMRDPTPEEAAQGVNGVPLTVSDLAKEKLDTAADAAEKAEKRIYDWMVESNYPAEMRKVIFDSARIGTGLLKGPFPILKKSRAAKKVNDGIAVEIVEKVQPGYTWLDVWNFFPDGACGENIHDGDHVFERDFLSPRKLKSLKRMTDTMGNTVYIGEQIDRVIEEGPGKCHTEGKNPAEKSNDKRFEVWYFTGTLSRKDMEAANAVGLEDLPDDLVEVNAIVTLVNDTVIRATVHPLDSGDFPYHPLPWSRRAGSWTGVGPGEQCFLAQAIVNAGTRTLLNNGGLSAGSQIVIDRSVIEPMDNNWSVTPDKFWSVVAGMTTEDVRKAFTIFEIPNVGKEMMDIINYGFRLAEEATNIPLISQGKADENTPETYGAAQIHNDNANALLRHLGYTVDDHVTEPVVHQSYEYLLMDPDVPDEEKGDFDINAKGSINMVEKAIQEQFLMQQANLVLNPVFEINPKKWYEEVLRGKRMDPRKLQFTKDELDEKAKQPPPEDPRIAAAKIGADARLQAAKMTTDATVQKSKIDTDRDTEFVNAQAERNRNDHTARMAELSVSREIEMLKLANSQNQTLEQIKADLSKTVMELNTQIKLAGADGTGPQVATPPMEPPGRAPDGEAYQK